MTRGRKRRTIDDDDSDTPAIFPTELLESALEGPWHSPTKVQRTMVAPVKARRKGPLPQSQSKSQVQANVGDSVDRPGFNEIPTNTHNDEISDNALELYVDAVHAYAAGFYHLYGRLFVVQGWDSRRHLSLNSWYHLEFLVINGSLVTACTCPRGLEGDALCIHRRFFEEYDIETLLSTDDWEDNDIPGAIVFRQSPVPNSPTINTFISVRSMSTSALKGRAIVCHRGLSPETGSWRCSKDSGSESCAHINTAMKKLRELYGDQGEVFEGDAEAPEARQIDDITRSNLVAVSYQAIQPPLWAALPTDTALYTRPPPFRTPPSTPIPIDPKSSCPCNGERSFYEPQRETHIRPCRIYTLTCVHVHQIELQQCVNCPASRRRYIGPDPREVGLFNYNNSVLVSHELLDEYTSAYTTSETPFTAWVTQVQRRYDLTQSIFMGEDLFRNIWFAYVSIQHWENDMTCTLCGPSPESVIWDGITLAFGRKHLTNSLQPPTTTTNTSIVRKNVKYFPKQQALLDSGLRKAIRAVLKGPGAGVMMEDNDDDTEDGDGCDEDEGLPSSPTKGNQQQRLASAREYLDRVMTVSLALKSQCPALSSLFIQNFGAMALEQGRTAPPVYRSFFRQIAAEESVLQLINYSSLLSLRAFLADAKNSDKTLLISIPAIYNLVKQHHSLDDLIPILRWLETRSRETLEKLIVEGPLPPASSLTTSSVSSDSSRAVPGPDLDWRETGCLYSMPKIRDRPKYPRLRGDQQQDKSDKRRGDRCGKYYTQYGQRRLTGGIMVVWCTHSICYGFHCIAASEGRDDVFSAMVTRWPSAPKRVIYDFACALGPYCMLREPLFFANTLFAIDHFHSTGHSKCSPACFLSEYANVDPRLVPINSSAGECGNGILKRIRKSVSYMSQQRAIIYTKVFLSSWNRQRIRLVRG